MTDELPVHVSRKSLHSLDVPSSFEVDGPFDVVFVNHGESVHVHVHLDDALSEVATVDANNHYVEGGSQRAVRIAVNRNALPEESALGKLKIVSGYGAQTRWIDIELHAPEEEDAEVQVDESLAEPQPRNPTEETEPLLPDSAMPVLGLGAVALIVAIVTVVFIEDTLVLLGALAVVAGVFAAIYLLIQE